MNDDYDGATPVEGKLRIDDEAFLKWARATHPAIILDLERAFRRYIVVSE